MINEENNSFWAVVEMKDHQRIAGKLSEFTFGGQSFIRVDVPDTLIQPAFSRLLGSSIYVISPCTEEVARYIAENLGRDAQEEIRKQLESEGKVLVPPIIAKVGAEYDYENTGSVYSSLLSDI